MTPYPTMKATELQRQAARYADLMIADLNALNKQYPRAKMTPEEEAVFLSRGGKDFSLDFEQLRSTFESTFCDYIVSRFVILPEK